MKLQLPFDQGQGLRRYDADGAVAQGDESFSPSAAPISLGIYSTDRADDIEFVSGVIVIYGGAGTGKSRLTRALLDSGLNIGYVGWGEPDPMPEAFGRPITGTPNVLVRELNDAFERHDVVILDSVRQYLLGGSGTQRGGVSGVFVNAGLTGWHTEIRAAGKCLITLVNPQSKDTGVDGDAYNATLNAIAGSVEAIYETQGPGRGNDWTRIRTRSNVTSPSPTSDGLSDPGLTLELSANSASNFEAPFKPE